MPVYYNPDPNIGLIGDKKLFIPDFQLAGLFGFIKRKTRQVLLPAGFVCLEPRPGIEPGMAVYETAVIPFNYLGQRRRQI